jgi:hypothetical protein
LLNAHHVKAIVVGGYARAFHGRPRYTRDIDILIEPTADNAARTIAALTDFGFGALVVTIEDLATPNHIIHLGIPPNQVDLVTSIDGVTFAEAWEGRASGHYGAQPVFFLGRNEFITNKRTVGRPIDLADIDDFL